MNKAQIYEDIFREYEKIRDDNKRIIETRKNKIYKQFPRIKKIDDEINLLGFEISKAILNAETDTEKNKYIEEIKNKNEKLNSEKKNILVNAGYAMDYLEPIYKCKICKDTGRVNNKKCSCLSQMYINAVYEMSKVKNIVKTNNFENFDLNFYSKKIDDEEGISPYENMKKNLKICYGFCENFDKEFKNFIFYGNSGLGKTFLCSSIAKELLDKGKIVIYVSAVTLFKIIEDEKFNRTEEDFDNSEFFVSLLEADLLIIDDLGTEFLNIVSASALFNIINTRFINFKPIIISTNLSPMKMTEQYSERIVSRIYGEYSVLKFFGDDIRILKRYKRL